MLDELRATPEVLYGAAVAFVIVMLLTPAVGGMARMLGAVDRPDARRLNRRPIPRLGGLAVVGAVDDFRGLSPPAKLGGQFVAAAVPLPSASGSTTSPSRSWA